MRYTISLTAATLIAGTAAAEVPVVVTDIPPVHSLVAQVMGQLGTPVLLLDRGADAHDFQMRPSQVAALADAGLVVWMGPDMSPWLDRALEGTETAAARMALLGVEGTALRPYSGGEGDHGDEEAAAEGEAHDHGHAEEGHEEAAAEGEAHDLGHAEEGHAEEGHDHAHDGTDPHAWLDPANAAVWLTAIAAELSRLDPDNAAAYAANATAAAEAVGTLDAAIEAQLAPVKDRPAVVFHDAYGYYTAHYGLSVLGAIALGDATSPGAAHLRELQEKAGEAVCVFPEANHDLALAAQMAEATGARLGPALDPEGASFEPGPGLYAALMTGLADGLVACLGAEDPA
jgi:zinc transport system substrate-binding protein